MNEMIVAPNITGLPAMLSAAAARLINAQSSAEVLEAREMAGAAYDAAKRAARLIRARDAHDELVAATNRAMADALEIEAGAKRRLADEYDAAQERGEVAGPNDGQHVAVPNGNGKATAADVGFTRKQIYEARQVRDAEEAEPGIVRRVLDEALDAGEEPTRAALKRAIAEPAGRVPQKKKERGVRQLAADKKLLKRLDESLAGLQALCTSLAELEFPPLTPEKLVQFLSFMREARTALTQTINKLAKE